jgi:hypothetical protein
MPGTQIICSILPQISCSYNCDDTGCTVPSSSLCKLYHPSPIWIIIHHTYILCTSFHRTTPDNVLMADILYSSLFYHSTGILTKTILLLSVEWSTHKYVFLFLPPWRWPHEWPKYVGGHYIIKLHSKIQMHLLVPLNFMHLIKAYNIKHIKVIDPSWP